jgi:hypothetical protein
MPPLTTLISEGSKYFGTSSANRELSAGVCSEGLRTTAFPAAMAWHCRVKLMPSQNQGCRTYRRAERQPDWIIERADDEADTFWVLVVDRSQWCRHQVERRFLWFSPFFNAIIRFNHVSDSGIYVPTRPFKQVVHTCKKLCSTKTHKSVSWCGLPRSDAAASLQRLMLSLIMYPS